MGAIEPEWRELWNRAPGATPFQSPEWLLPWVRHLWGGGKLLVLALRSGSRLEALAPFFLWGYERQPKSVTLSFLGSGISDYLDILAAPETAQEAAGRILHWLADANGEWDICDLQELRPESPLLGAAPPATLTLSNSSCGVCPVTPLPDSLERLLARIDPKFRTDLRRAENRLRAKASIEFMQAGPDTWRDLLETLFRLHTARWEQRDDRGVLGADALRAFHRESAAALLAAGMLRLYGLFANGECVAVQYNLAAKGRAYAYLSGFDPAWSKCSPGSVLLAHSIACAIEEGAREFDFLRKREDFKYNWRAEDRLNRRLALAHAARRAGNVP